MRQSSCRDKSAMHIHERTLNMKKLPLLCGGYALLSQHELCCIDALFWSGFDADFYADIDDLVQTLCTKKCSVEALTVASYGMG